MKRGIEVCPGYDAAGAPLLHIEKQRGKLTLEEIRQAAQEFDEDIYALIIDARQDEGQCFEEAPPGDRVTLYRAERFFREKTAVHDEGVRT